VIARTNATAVARDPDGGPLLCMSEAAIYVGVPALTFMTMVEQRRMPMHYTRKGTKRLWRCGDLDRYLPRPEAPGPNP
jgi:excisionase family DNA binding protein